MCPAGGWPRLRYYFANRHNWDDTHPPCDCGIPQRSVIGPLLFSTNWSSPMGSYHQFADDTQLFISTDTAVAVSALELLTNVRPRSVFGFCANGDAGHRHRRPAGSSFHTSSHLRSHGLTTVLWLTHMHVTEVSTACNYNVIRAFRHIQSLLSDELTHNVVWVALTTVTHFCTGPSIPLQQAAAHAEQPGEQARVFTRRIKGIKATPSVQLPLVNRRICYKFLLLTYTKSLVLWHRTTCLITYRVAQKIGTIKLAPFLYALTSSNINRFSQFFRCRESGENL